MYIYFSSAYPSAIKLNGIYFGTIDQETKSCNIELKEKPFVEICPLGNDPTVNFILSEELINCPPKGLTVTDLKGGYLIHANKTQSHEFFKIIGQEKYNDLIATVFYENGLKLSLETPSDFFADNFTIDIESCSFQRFSLNGNNFIAVLLNGKSKTLVVYRITDKINQVFCDEVDSFNAENLFETTQKHKDIAKHTVITSWQYDGKTLIAKNVKVVTAETFCIDNLHEKILPFAFIEEFIVGGDIVPYLGGNVLENKDKLKGFFGEFIGIIPPPVFRSQSEVGLIYKKSENLFFAEYFTFALENRKIINVKKI